MSDLPIDRQKMVAEHLACFVKHETLPADSDCKEIASPSLMAPGSSCSSPRDNEKTCQRERGQHRGPNHPPRQQPRYERPVSVRLAPGRQKHHAQTEADNGESHGHNSSCDPFHG